MSWGKNRIKNIPKVLNNVFKVTAGEGVNFAFEENGRSVVWGNAGLKKPFENVKVTQVSQNGGYYLALLPDGTVADFGKKNDSHIPPDIPLGLKNVIQVANGDQNIALKSDGTIRCWGKGQYPRTLKNIIQVATNRGKNYALAEDGNVFSWDISKGEANNHFFVNREVIQIQVAGSSLFCLTKEGKVFSDYSYLDFDNVIYLGQSSEWWAPLGLILRPPTEKVISVDGDNIEPIIEYYPNGKKRRSGQYNDSDEKHGVWWTWWENGNLRSEERYLNGQLLKGSQYYWDSSGEMTSELLGWDKY